MIHLFKIVSTGIKSTTLTHTSVNNPIITDVINVVILINPFLIYAVIINTRKAVILIAKDTFVFNISAIAKFIES